MLIRRQLTAIGHLGNTGVANAFVNNCKALAAVADVEIMPYNQMTRPQYKNILVHLLPQQTEDVVERLKDSFEDSFNIGYWVCESTKLRDQFHKWQHYFGKLWTCSKWCADILGSELNREVEVFPHMVSNVRWDNQVNEVYTFLTVFDGGSRVLRKNPFGLIKAFQDAFGGMKDVRLVIKVRNLGAGILKALYESAVTSPNIKFIDKEYDDIELNNLFINSDCIVSLHRSEGFGLQMLEAMALGKIVIATGYSGNLDYMVDGENSFLVDYKLVDCQDDFYLGQWAEPDHDDAVSKLRHVYSAREALEPLRWNAFNTGLENSFVKGVRTAATLMQ